MSIESTIKAKTAELRELFPLVESGDSEAIKAANAIADDLDELRKQKGAADRFRALLGDLGPEKGKEGASKLVKTISDGLSGVDVSHRFTRSVDLKASATDILTAPEILTMSTTVPEMAQDMTVMDLFGQDTITGNSIKYFVALGFTGTPAIVAEGAQKPQMGPSYQTRSDELHKVAGYWKETDEALEDAPYLASALRTQGIYLLRASEDAKIVKGAGGDDDIEGIWNRTGVQTLQYTPASAGDNGDLAAKILLAASNVKRTSKFRADAVVLNPLDYYKLRTAVDQNGQFYGGGYFTGPYGNGQIAVDPALWGMRTVQSDTVSEGEALIGAFKIGGSVFRKAGSSLRLEVANQNEDDFTHNRITVLVEERIGLMVRYPQAFVKLTAQS